MDSDDDLYGDLGLKVAAPENRPGSTSPPRDPRRGGSQSHIHKSVTVTTTNSSSTNLNLSNLIVGSGPATSSSSRNVAGPGTNNSSNTTSGNSLLNKLEEGSGNAAGRHSENQIPQTVGGVTAGVAHLKFSTNNSSRSDGQNLNTSSSNSTNFNTATVNSSNTCTSTQSQFTPANPNVTTQVTTNSGGHLPPNQNPSTSTTNISKLGSTNIDNIDTPKSRSTSIICNGTVNNSSSSNPAALVPQLLEMVPLQIDMQPQLAALDEIKLLEEKSEQEEVSEVAVPETESAWKCVQIRPLGLQKPIDMHRYIRANPGVLSQYDSARGLKGVGKGGSNYYGGGAATSFREKIQDLRVGPPPAVPGYEIESSGAGDLPACAVIVANLVSTLGEIALRKRATDNCGGLVRYARFLEHPRTGCSFGIAVLEFTSPQAAKRALQSPNVFSEKARSHGQVVKQAKTFPVLAEEYSLMTASSEQESNSSPSGPGTATGTNADSNSPAVPWLHGGSCSVTLRAKLERRLFGAEVTVKEQNTMENQNRLLRQSQCAKWTKQVPQQPKAAAVPPGSVVPNALKNAVNSNPNRANAGGAPKQPPWHALKGASSKTGAAGPTTNSTSLNTSSNSTLNNSTTAQVNLTPGPGAGTPNKPVPGGGKPSSPSVAKHHASYNVTVFGVDDYHNSHAGWGMTGASNAASSTAQNHSTNVTSQPHPAQVHHHSQAPTGTVHYDSSSHARPAPVHKVHQQHPYRPGPQHHTAPHTAVSASPYGGHYGPGASAPRGAWAGQHGQHQPHHQIHHVVSHGGPKGGGHWYGATMSPHQIPPQKYAERTQMQDLADMVNKQKSK